MPRQHAFQVMLAATLFAAGCSAPVTNEVTEPTGTPVTTTAAAPSTPVVRRGIATGARALGDWDLKANSHDPLAALTIQGVVEKVDSRYVEHAVHSTLTIRVEKAWGGKGSKPARVTATRLGGVVPMKELLPELIAKDEAKNLTEEQKNGLYEEAFFGTPNSAPGDHFVAVLAEAGSFGEKMDAEYSILGGPEGIFWIEGDELVQKGDDLAPTMKKRVKRSQVEAIVTASN